MLIPVVVIALNVSVAVAQKTPKQTIPSPGQISIKGKGDVQVGAGTICFAPGRFTDTAAEERVLDWLRLLGRVVRLEERQFDAATALSGSGPAFIGLVIEAFEDAGIVAGLSHAKARELILTTVLGTATMLDVSDLTCSELRRMVTSPGGTAATGLAALERAGVRGAIIDGVLAAMRRAAELG